MKLKILPPTLKKNNRYLVVDIKIDSQINKDEIVSIIWNACIHFCGELNAADFNLWVMRFFKLNKIGNYYNYKAVVRCQRGYEQEVRSSIALVNKVNGKKIAMTTIALSGTINGALKFI